MSVELCENVCKQLKHLIHLEYLSLVWNDDVGAYSHYIAEAIEACGCGSPLRLLNLSGSGNAVSRPLLSAISKNCQLLTVLRLSRNILTNVVDAFIPENHSGLHCLEDLELNDTGLTKDDILHLIYLVRFNELPGVKRLVLQGNSLCEMDDKLSSLITTYLIHYQRELELFVKYNSLSREFKNKWKRSSEGTKVELSFDGPAIADSDTGFETESQDSNDD